MENGQIGPAVSETMISGNLAGMLKHIRGISKETVEDGTGSLPWLAVDGITISGK
ncbi:MAG TPA: metallopeptidase TldD-related protein [Clostridia bacterium]|nr:metallopeptidase TldD-related protein [Clostridia bacterium]